MGKNINIQPHAYIGNGDCISIGDNSGLGKNFTVQNTILEIGSNVMIANDLLIIGGGIRMIVWIFQWESKGIMKKVI